MSSTLYESLRRAALRVTMIAAVYTAIVAGALLVDAASRRGESAWDASAYLALREAALAAETTAEGAAAARLVERLKQDVRRVDAEIRAEYFRRQRFAAVGATLLIAGMAVTLSAALAAAALRRPLPKFPEATAVEDRRDATLAQGRWAVVVAVAVTVVGLASLYFVHVQASAARQRTLAALAGPVSPHPQPLSQRERGEAAPGGASQPVAELAEPPTVAELSRQWPRFRGFEGSGHAAPDATPPLGFNEAQGENLRWKTPIPLPGFGSVVVWNDRVFLSGADAKERAVYCLAADDGRRLWTGDVPNVPDAGLSGDPPPPPKVKEYTGYAACTAVTDGRVVVAMFGSGHVAAFDIEGERRWIRHLGVPKNAYGHAASLDLFQNLVIVQFDQGGRDDGLSAVYALNIATGETVWKTPRAIPNSWPTPLVIHDETRPQLVTCGDPWVISYDPRDGKERWRCKALQGDVGPSPVRFQDVVYVANEFPALSAIDITGSGDVTDEHLLWQGEFSLPDKCSPLVTEKHVLLLTSYGDLVCYPRSGAEEPLWEEAFDVVDFGASPSLARGHVYLFGETESEETDAEGNPLRATAAWTVTVSDEGCEIVAKNQLDEGVLTSPAFINNRIYLRSRQSVYCLGK